MMIMEGNNMSKTEYDLKAIIYSAYNLVTQQKGEHDFSTEHWGVTYGI